VIDLYLLWRGRLGCAVILGFLLISIVVMNLEVGWLVQRETGLVLTATYAGHVLTPPVGHSPWPHTTWRRNVSAVRALICQPHPAAAAADISPCICCPAHLPLILSTHHTERAAVSMILPDINILSSLLVSVGTHQPGHRLLLLVGCDVILLVGCDDVLLVGCDDVLLVGCDLDVPDVPMS
jgi:hypothetical protein